MIIKFYRALLTVVVILSLCACNANNENSTDGFAMDNDDYCPTGAFYDIEEDACYIDCDSLSDEECDALEQQVFGDLEDFIVTEYSGRESNQEDSDSVIARYQVESDLSITEISNLQPDHDPTFRQIWDSALRVLPKAVLQQHISQFVIDSDGPEETLAYVTVDEDKPNKWIIAFDDQDYIGPKDKEFIHTTIHEFGHIVFLGMEQLNVSALGSCESYAIDEGCTLNNSYLNRFFQLFWTNLFNEHQEAQGDEDAQYQFYEDNANHFVSEYAATDPVEDAAEIFTHFVLREKPTDTLSIVNQKILFMHEIDVLKKLRSTIRGKLQVAN